MLSDGALVERLQLTCQGPVKANGRKTILSELMLSLVNDDFAT
jgi:hypothetical protein